MLPDFPKAKKAIHRALMRRVRAQVPTVAPLLQGIATLRQHEGRQSTLTRSDASESTIQYQVSEFAVSMTRDEMKRLDASGLLAKFQDLARQIGEHQTKHMLELVKDAADQVGNVVRHEGDITQDQFLEIFRRIQMDFDPATLEIAPGMSFVMHPDMASTVVPKIQSWEAEPAFKEKYERIIALKREEWRDREARRKLVS